MNRFNSTIERVSKKKRLENKKHSELKAYLIEKHGRRCMTCGSNGDIRGISLSHIISLSRGGKTTIENCLLEDYICHSKRHGLREV